MTNLVFPVYPRPADPVTGLPDQPFTSVSLRLWLCSILTVAIITQLSLLWAWTALKVDPPAPVPASTETTSKKPAALTVHDGRQLYRVTCTACHGPKAKGVPGLGKDLTQANPFMKDTAEDALIKLIVEGRTADDPANTTKIAMPPNGGNSELREDEVRAIVKYLKTLKS